jgi:hypothetical protein
VLFSRGVGGAAETQAGETVAAPVQDDASLGITDAERSSLTFTTYDLDVHLIPASAGMAVRAGLTVKNDGAAPLGRLVMEITSSLHWDAISSRSTGSPGAAGKVPSPARPLSFAVRQVDTDADHTGAMNEAVITLAQPLAPGASMSLTALYSGAIAASAERLVRIGAPAGQALAADWDAIAAGGGEGLSSGTALRGFGNVLWYPVAAPPLFLGDGAKLFQAVGAMKLRESLATVRLRLAVEYAGDPPDAAFFCGRREQLIALSDDPDLPVAESRGIATAEFDAQALGFRTMSLFVTDRAASETGTAANPALIAAVTGHDNALPSYAAAAELVEPLLTDWLGARPLMPLTILDHAGEPFEDGALLVRPMRVEEAATLAPSLAHSLTHAWVRSSHPWIDEGLAQFVSLLWTERTAGRAALLDELEEGARTLALAEPETPAPESSSASGQSLIEATSDVFYRTKAAAVWWMLRGIVGDEVLKQAIQAYRADAKLDRDPEGFEHTLERFTHKDVRWLFEDWVYRDRGLPDLSIANVAPSQLESRAGVPSAWLIAVEVHNDGYAAAEVPVTVRAGTVFETLRLRIAGRSSASTRIVFSGTPEQVEVNDGSVPEAQSSTHVRKLVRPGR